MDDTLDIGEIVENRERVVESLANMERNGETEVAGELKHALKEADLGGAIEGFVMIIEADFADSNEFGAIFGVDSGETRVVVGVFGVDAVGAENVFVSVDEGLSVFAIIGVGADDDDLVDSGFFGILEKLLGLGGREPLLVVEVTVGVDKIS